MRLDQYLASKLALARVLMTASRIKYRINNRLYGWSHFSEPLLNIRRLCCLAGVGLDVVSHEHEKSPIENYRA